MTRKIRKSNWKRLASLSALGAGALGVTAGTTDASTIVFSGIVDEKMGFGPGYGSHSLSIAGPNGVAVTMGLRTGFFPPSDGTSSGYYIKAASVGGRNGDHGTVLRFRGIFTFFPVGFSQGARFGHPVSSRSIGGGNIAESLYGTTGGYFNSTHFNATDDYLLFKFTGGDLPHPIYGWAQLNVSLPGQFGGPNITLVDWAYDLSGAQIPAGDTGTPEPSTLALTGLAALALGAKGLRTWRAARKTA